MPNAVVKVADVMRTSLHMVNGLASVQDAIAEMNRLGVSSLLMPATNTAWSPCATSQGRWSAPAGRPPGPVSTR
jgi:predicted transcriptional regulator